VDLFDATQFNQKILDGPALQLFSVRNCRLACPDFPEYEQWLFPGTLLQLVMRVEFRTRRAWITLLEMAHAALQRLIADRHDDGHWRIGWRRTADASRGRRTASSSVWAGSW
jgi:hypothetical protein